jgi:hypothetical protein
VKTKYLWLGASALILTGGLWFARAAWRAHYQLVTLHVRNVPLTEVLRKIEWQTWKKIRAEKALDARITLNVVNKPLVSVLDRLAEQAGARWSTLYAVYDSPRTLNALNTALSGDGKLEPAGWTKLAPEPPKFGEAGEPGYLPQPGMAPEIEKLPPGFAPGPIVTATEDSVMDNPSPGKSKAGTTDSRIVRQAPRAFHIVRKGANDGGVQEEVWTAEELVVETTLKARIGNEQPPNEIPVAAAQTAQKLKAHWTTYLAFRKSALGIGFGDQRFRRFARGGPGPELNGTNIENLQAQGPPPDFEEAAKQERNDQFEKLTAEQRVRRARERLGSTEN